MAPRPSSSRRRSSRCADVVGVNCSIGPGADARNHRADGRRDTRAAVGAAECRPSARYRRAKPLSVVARVRRVLRAAVHQPGCPARRRLLRHDARAHPADRDCRQEAGAGSRAWRDARCAANRIGAGGCRRPKVCPPVPKAERSPLARALVSGTLRHDRPAHASERLPRRRR